MKHWKLWAGITLVFILGLSVGSIGSNIFYGHGFSHFGHKDAAERNAEVLERFRKDLSLTDPQATRVKAIIAQMETQRTEYFRKSRTELKAITESGFALIRLELTPEQQKLFDDYQARMEKARKEREQSRK
jgi:Spy/CpxP family protein refolding chaperone